jgi:hypothetical protein
MLDTKGQFGIGFGGRLSGRGSTPVASRFGPHTVVLDAALPHF